MPAPILAYSNPGEVLKQPGRYRPAPRQREVPMVSASAKMGEVVSALIAMGGGPDHLRGQ